MLIPITAFLLALATGWLLTPVVRDAAHGAGLLDEPEARKVHVTPIPRLGGVAIAGAFYVGIAAGLVTARSIGDTLNLEDGHLPAILVGVALIGGVGLLDDLQGMRARVKLAAQVIVALVTYGLGLSIDRLDGPWGSLALGPWSLVLTVLWIVAIINALNLIDGLDGLASGIAVIAMIAFVVIGGGLQGMIPIEMVVAAGAGGVLGFLRHNLQPASIIMGDAGAMFLGLLMAITTITIGGRTTDPFSGQTYFYFAPLLIPLVILGVPIVDTAFAFVRRVVRRQHFAERDREHLHHRLMRMGHGPRRVVVILWLWTALLSAVVLLPTFTDRGNTLVVPAVIALGLLLYIYFHPGVRSARQEAAMAALEAAEHDERVVELDARRRRRASG